MDTCQARHAPGLPDAQVHHCGRAGGHADVITCLLCKVPCDRADHRDRHECPWCGAQWTERSRHVFLPSPVTRFHQAPEGTP